MTIFPCVTINDNIHALYLDIVVKRKHILFLKKTNQHIVSV